MKRLLTLTLACAMLLLCAACGSSSETSSSSASEEVTEVEDETSEYEEPSEPEEVSEVEEEEEEVETGTNDTPAADEPSASSVSLPIVDEPVTYTMFMTEPFFIASMIDDMSADLLLFKTAQEYTNIYFDVTAINGEVFEDQFQLMLASGDYADVMDGMSNYTSGYDAAIDEEICIDLYDLVKEYAPNYWSAISSDVETLAQLVTDKGQMATFAILYTEANCETQGYLVRADWLSEQNLTVPSTYDELHDLLVAFRDAYGSQGITFMGYNDELLSYGYECAGGDFMVIDGEVVSGYTVNGYYDFVSMCTDWYAEGLICEDYYSSSEGDYTDLMVSNNLSVMQGAATSFSTIYAYLQEGDKLSLTAMLPVKVEENDDLHFTWNYPNLLKRSDAWSIATTCEDPIPLVEFVNYMYTDEGKLLFNYGVEHETFEFDENGDPQYTDMVINNPDQPYFFASYLYVSNAATEYFPARMDVSASYYDFGDEEWNAYELFRDVTTDSEYNYPAGAVLTQEEQTRYAQLNSDIDTYVDETVNSWIVGTTAFNREAYDEFAAQLNAMGMDEIVSLKQAAYDRYLDKVNQLQSDIG